MKKLLAGIIMLISILTFNVQAKQELPEVTDHEKVHIYLFYSLTCPHCHDFLTYFYKNYDDDYAKYFDIISFEASTSENGVIYSAAKEKLDIDEEGVPLIIWGDQFQVGFGTDGSNIIESVLEQYQNEDYHDYVNDVLEENKVNYKMENFDETLTAMGIKRAKGDWLIVTAIFVVLIGGIGSLFFISRKK